MLLWISPVQFFRYPIDSNAPDRVNIHLRLLMARNIVPIQHRIVSYDVQNILVPADINDVIINLCLLQARFIDQSIDILSGYVAS